MAILISVPGLLVFSYDGATLRLEQERNGSNVSERFHGILYPGAPCYSANLVPSGNWLHALRVSLASPSSGRHGVGVVFAGYPALDAARVSYSPLYLSLRTQDASGKAAALYRSRRSS